jgi:ABC-type cobalamin/Fe3+-siderophores transport system ATPase subunit
MVPRSEIDLGKELGILQLIQEVIDPRKRILVLDCHDIQISIVDAHPHRAILLFHKQDRRALG